MRNFKCLSLCERTLSKCFISEQFNNAYADSCENSFDASGNIVRISMFTASSNQTKVLFLCQNMCPLENRRSQFLGLSKNLKCIKHFNLVLLNHFWVFLASFPPNFFDFHWSSIFNFPPSIVFLSFIYSVKWCGNSNFVYISRFSDRIKILITTIFLRGKIALCFKLIPWELRNCMPTADMVFPRTGNTVLFRHAQEQWSHLTRNRRKALRCFPAHSGRPRGPSDPTQPYWRRRSKSLPRQRWWYRKWTGIGSPGRCWCASRRSRRRSGPLRRGRRWAARRSQWPGPVCAQRRFCIFRNGVPTPTNAHFVQVQKYATSVLTSSAHINLCRLAKGDKNQQFLVLWCPHL